MKILVRIALGALVAIVVVVGFLVSQAVCISAWSQYGMVVRECPAGRVLPVTDLNAQSLRRGAAGSVRIQTLGAYTTGAADSVRRTAVSPKRAELFLSVDGKETKLEPTKPWTKQGKTLQGQVRLDPSLPDGDHKLIARTESAAGKSEVEVNLALYAPARIHVITDRPLYEPGNVIKMRAVALRARDLVPLEKRPGTFVVTDPNGMVVLEKEAAAGPFGVVAAELPLDDGAPVGTWRVAWRSGGAEGASTVTVEPFTLPRFTVTATSVRPVYLPGQRPRVTGEVRYASGAAVAADLTIRWSTSGDWPPPTSWLKKDLPKTARTDRGGRFELLLPEIPQDLVGQAGLHAVFDAVDPTGDRAQTSASVLLSKDAISANVVTELDGKLLEGFNNRMYLRVTTAAGRPLGGVGVTVQRAWDETDPGEQAKTDADGVALLQLDPGAPVTVVVPPLPVRPPEPPEPIERTAAKELITERAPSLAELAALDRLQKSLADCRKTMKGTSETAELSVVVTTDGRVDTLIVDDPLERCLGRILSRARFPRGPDRIFELRYQLRNDGPRFQHSTFGPGSPPGVVKTELDLGLSEARACLPRAARRSSSERMVLWKLVGQTFSARWVTDARRSGGAKPSKAQQRCLERALATAVQRRKIVGRYDDDDPAVGGIRFSVSPGAAIGGASAPKETTWLGYELKVTAKGDEELIGSTLLRLRPGKVPNLRLRASPVLPKAGGKVSVELLRGRNFRGKLPKKLWLRHEQKSIEAKLDPETRKAEFTLPAGLDGWFTVDHGGASARVYVRPTTNLSVELTPSKPVLAPGETVDLAVVTRSESGPTAAAVGLIGVDETLGVLTALPGPDAMAELRPKVSMKRPAFGVLEGTALTQGRIRGEHAAAATVLLVGQVPRKEELDIYVSGSGRTSIDVLGPLTDHFYAVLGVLHTKVRAWEKTASKGEVMKAKKMADLWQQAVKDHKAAGGDVEDAFGRTLTLKRLPSDLLLLVDPRNVVLDGKRLPEDEENWAAWVAGRRS